MRNLRDTRPLVYVDSITVVLVTVSVDSEWTCIDISLCLKYDEPFGSTSSEDRCSLLGHVHEQLRRYRSDKCLYRAAISCKEDSIFNGSLSWLPRWR